MARIGGKGEGMVLGSLINHPDTCSLSPGNSEQEEGTKEPSHLQEAAGEA